AIGSAQAFADRDVQPGGGDPADQLLDLSISTRDGRQGRGPGQGRPEDAMGHRSGVGETGATHPDLVGRRPVSADRKAGAARLIDSHAHLLYLRDSLTPEQALEDARQAGVEAVINIGDDASDNRRGLELTERLP